MKKNFLILTSLTRMSKEDLKVIVKIMNPKSKSAYGEKKFRSLHINIWQALGL